VEETQVGLFGIVPFSIETEFKKLGAIYEEADAWNPKVFISLLKKTALHIFTFVIVFIYLYYIYYLAHRCLAASFNTRFLS
jgi:hypothetical protein